MNLFEIDFYDQKGQLLPETGDWPAQWTVGQACEWLAKYSKTVKTNIPKEHLALVPHNQPLKLQNAIARDAKLQLYRIVGLYVVRLPHIGESARRTLLERLLQLTPGRLDADSIRESSAWSSAAASANGLYDSATLLSLSPTLPQTSIQFEGEPLFPFRLLPNDGGVEFRSDYTYEYRAMTAEARSTQVKLQAAIAHCRKLLVDLPIALKNSESAMEAHAKADDVDLNTLGAMSLEQVRIKQEITNQRVKLPQLEQEDVASKKNLPSSMQLHKHQTQVTLPFGQTKVGDRTYHLQAIAASRTSSTGQAVPMTIDCE